MIVYDGPIESRTWEHVRDLPEHTYLYGQIWTGGPRVIIRYYAARLPNGRKIPFCAVVGEGGPGLEKSPGRPGSAVIQSHTTEAFITGQFH